MNKCKYLGVVTGKEFETHYNNMVEKGNIPVASTLIPVKATDNEENTAIFHVWIYYSEYPGVKQPEKKKELKLEL